eukprot:2507732-Pyramimonas_sp.AAC.1
MCRSGCGWRVRAVTLGPSAGLRGVCRSGCGWRAMAVARGFSVEPPTCEGCAEVGVADACGQWHWGLHSAELSKATKRVRGVPIEVSVTGACGRWHWGFGGAPYTGPWNV